MDISYGLRGGLKVYFPSSYNFMLSCWHHSPDQRPSADHLVKFLSVNSDDVISVASEGSSTNQTALQSPTLVSTVAVATVV